MRRWMIGLVGGLALAAAMPAAAQVGSEGAEAFVRGVFAGYSANGEDEWPLAEYNLSDVFSARMAGLIRRDRALAEDDLPYLDADPLCQCQDWGDFRVESVRIIHIARMPGRRADVTFTNFGQRETTRLQLSGDPISGWRIDDVLTPGQPGLAEQLEESNRRREAGLPALQRD